MKRKSIACLLFAGVLAFADRPASSQPPRGPWVVSPQVNPDHTVVFRYLAPTAREVLLNGQFDDKPQAMTRDSIGIWSVTVGPIKPDIYPYNFIVDGISVMDPANTEYFPNERFKASLVDVPSNTPLMHSLQDVPHGTVTYEYYPSAAGTTGCLVIYTPPGYEHHSKKYPVFYLISGTTDTEETWFKVGRANLILDNLIAQGKAKPMIIVMPYGNIEARIAAQTGKPKPADPANREGEEAVNRARAFGQDLVNNVIPHVEKNYRVLANRSNRAIGGFSRGGGQTLRTAFDHLDRFAWICCYSAYLSGQEMERDYCFIYENPKRTNQQLKLLWVSVGSEDFLYQQTLDFLDFLEAKSLRHKRLITSGGHTWMNTKLFLTESAQLLFQ